MPGTYLVLSVAIHCIMNTQKIRLEKLGMMSFFQSSVWFDLFFCFLYFELEKEERDIERHVLNTRVWAIMLFLSWLSWTKAAFVKGDEANFSIFNWRGWGFWVGQRVLPKSNVIGRVTRSWPLIHFDRFEKFAIWGERSDVREGTVCSNGFYADIWSQRQVQQ